MAVLVTSCLGTRYLQEGERLLTKQKIKGNSRLNQEDLQSLITLEPNARLLGLPISTEAYMYEWGKAHHDTAFYRLRMDDIQQRFDKRIIKTKKDKKKARLITTREKKTGRLRRKIEEGNWRMRQGRPLAVYDSTLVAISVENLANYLQTEGYFDSKALATQTLKSKNYVENEYLLLKGQRYRIDSIEYQTQDPKVAAVLANRKSLINKGTVYSQRTLGAERDGIVDDLRNNGFFDFGRQFIYFEVDSISLGDKHILLRQIITNPPEHAGHKVFHIDSVIFVDNNPNIPDKRISSHYKGISFQFSSNKYNRDLLSRRIFIKKDSIYRHDNALETQRQLANLDAFKFININFDTTGGKFIANIFTSPLNKFETSNEIGLSSTARLPGPFFTVGLKNRNTFNGLELLEINGNMTLQGIGNIANKRRNYTLLQYGGILSLHFPMFQFPFLSDRIKNRISRFNPATSLSFQYNFEDRFTEYEREIFNASWGYSWQVSERVSYKLTPFSIGYVSSKLEPSFQEFLETLRLNGNGSYAASFQSALLSTASAEMVINNNNYGNKVSNSSFVRLFGESGGNITNVLSSEFLDLGQTQYQFFKFVLDYRNSYVLNRRSLIASRLHIGVGNPYGADTVALPYEKYFYIAGSNSIRAWPARRLGPGDFAVFNEAPDGGGLRTVNYTLEQGGELIIETSVEYRSRITGFLNWAFFIDAGNIWQLKSTPLLPINSDVPKPESDGKFSASSFLNEMAVGAGLGLRIDFGYLVFRIDAAAQVVDPAQQPGSRFVFDNIKFLSAFKRIKFPDSPDGQQLQAEKDFLSNKTRINFGIGFPF